jgi:hypothetical protein
MYVRNATRMTLISSVPKSASQNAAKSLLNGSPSRYREPVVLRAIVCAPGCTALCMVVQFFFPNRQKSSCVPEVRVTPSEANVMDRAHSALANERTRSALAYVVLLSTCLAGVFHAPWWAACAGACSLALILLIPPRAAPAPQMRTIGEPVLIFSSVLNASAVASGAFIFGHVARWLWGL